MRHTISGKTAITAVAITISNPSLNPNPTPKPIPNPNQVTVTISAGLAPVVSIAPTGFFAPRKVNSRMSSP